MSYGIIFWGNSHHSNSTFKIQKKNNKNHYNDLCHQLFKQLQILSLPSQYIFSLLVFVTKNRGLFQTNSEFHDLNTHSNHNLHLPSTNLIFRKEYCILEVRYIITYLQILKICQMTLSF